MSSQVGSPINSFPFTSISNLQIISCFTVNLGLPPNNLSNAKSVYILQ